MWNKFYSLYRHSLITKLRRPMTPACSLGEACASLKRFAKINSTWVLKGRGVNMRLEHPEIGSVEYYCIARIK